MTCHIIGTPIMMYDGTIKKIQDVIIGDLVMGDDSLPKVVTKNEYHSGDLQLYKIVPTKGDSYISSSVCLKFNKRRSNKFNSIFHIPIKEYIHKTINFKNLIAGFRVPITFPEKDIPFDPYMIGYWLGDGTRCSISCQEAPVLHYFNKNLGKYNLYLAYRNNYIYDIKSCIDENYFFKIKHDLRLLPVKHIPLIYKCNSRDKQIELLAGIIDADGSAINGGWEFTQKNEKLFDDVLFLCRSLGFACYKSIFLKGGESYLRCNISGTGIEDVPCRILRKKLNARAQIKNVLNVGLKIETTYDIEYFKIEIDGEKFCLGDFTAV